MLQAAANAALNQSHTGVSETYPEPECDILAQLECLADQSHPKQSVFLAYPADIPDFPYSPKWRSHSRNEGTLITLDQEAFNLFSTAQPLTDTHLAKILGYPESKAEVMQAPWHTVVQATNKNDCVVWECGCSKNGFGLALAEANHQTPSGGQVLVLSGLAALERRQGLRRS